MIFCFCEFQKPLSVTEKKTKTMPVLNLRSIAIPTAMQESQDSVVQLAVEVLSYHNSLNEYVRLVEIPMDSVDSGQPWMYTWKNSDNVQVKLKVTEGAHNNLPYYYFSVYYDEFDSSKGIQYSNWNNFYCNMSVSGDDIYLELRRENSAERLLSFWYESLAFEAETYRFGFDYPVPENVKFTYCNLSINKSNIIQYGDVPLIASGGWMEFATPEHIRCTMTWDLSGHGSWELREIVSSDIIGTGTW